MHIWKWVKVECKKYMNKNDNETNSTFLAEYENLYNIITGYGDVKQLKVYKTFIVMFYSELVELILPEDFYILLQETKCLR